MYSQSFILYVALRFAALIGVSVESGKLSNRTFVPHFLLSLVLSASIVTIGCIFRVEMAANPFVTLFSLIRSHQSLTTAALICVVVAMTYYSILVFCYMNFYYQSQRQLKQKHVPYARLRRHFLSSKTLLFNTLWLFFFASVLFACCSALFPPSVVPVTPHIGWFKELVVLDVPYYARGGYSLIVFTGTMTELYLHMPLRDPNKIELFVQRILPALFQIPDNSEGTGKSFQWSARKDSDGHWKSSKNVFIMEEVRCLYPLAKTIGRVALRCGGKGKGE